MTRSSLLARATAVLYASDDFRMLKTKKTMQRTNRTPAAIRVRHPVGTNHFQLRCHQICAAAAALVAKAAVEFVPSNRSACGRKVSPAICIASYFRLSRQLAEKDKSNPNMRALRCV